MNTSQIIVCGMITVFIILFLFIMPYTGDGGMDDEEET